MSKGLKKYKCKVCKASSCGDDLHTVTQYLGPEIAVGDRLKIILLQAYDMVDYDNLQASEIKALILNLIDQHIIETDEMEK